MRMLSIVILCIFCDYVFGQGCQTSYQNYAIMGSDLKSVSGASSTCCQACQQQSGCTAFTWSSINGGTCFLKSDVQPLYAANGQFTVIMSPDPTRTYSLNTSYDSTNFFDLFNFATHNYGNGYTNFTDKNTAISTGIAKILPNGQVTMGKRTCKDYRKEIYLGTDNVTQLPWNDTKGRNAIRLESLNRFDSGLFIFNIDHMPTGPGTWPAFWTTNPSWPTYGEIDILESISEYEYNQISLHTDAGCTMNANNSMFFTGQWGMQKTGPMTDCETGGDHYGCGIQAQNGTFNMPFNQAGGGVFALEWDHQKFIRVWNFVKPNIPSDITNNSPHPNPATWGMPAAYYPFGDLCPPTHVQKHMITINLAYCGWAGQMFPGGECACENAVRFGPGLYTDGYFLVNYLKVYCRPGDPCLVS